MGIDLGLFLEERLEKDFNILSLFHHQDLNEVKLGEIWKQYYSPRKQEFNGGFIL